MRVRISKTAWKALTEDQRKTLIEGAGDAVHLGEPLDDQLDPQYLQWDDHRIDLVKLAEAADAAGTTVELYLGEVYE